MCWFGVGLNGRASKGPVVRVAQLNKAVNIYKVTGKNILNLTFSSYILNYIYAYILLYSRIKHSYNLARTYRRNVD